MKSKFSFESISKYRGALMGFLILQIIFFHFTEDSKASGLHYTGFIPVYYTWIRSSGVDLFLFLSGFGLYYSWMKNPDYGLFLKRRLSRIFVPYFLVAIPAWAWRDFLMEGRELGRYFMDLFFVTMFTERNSWFWYFLMSFLCYLVFPLVFWMVTRPKRQSLAAVWTAASVLAVAAAAFYLRAQYPDFYRNVSMMLLRVPAFVLGTFAGRLAKEKRQISSWIVGAGCIGIIILTGPMGWISRPVVSSYARMMINMVLCLVLIYGMEYLEKWKIQHWIRQGLEWFGRYSLELYLLHVMVRRVMKTYGYHTSSVRYQVIMVAITLILSVILKLVTEKIITKVWKA